MLYSCLVDGDYLDTEAFLRAAPPPRGGHDPLPVLLERLEGHISGWWPPKTDLNRRRCQILRACLDGGDRPRGLYTLTVPTGGGKTVASLAFALRHAIANGLDRVIYIIPYTSIIEQNAAVFRDILGEGNVVEHHSGVNWDPEDETAPARYRQTLAAENFDAPVVVTTAVQFFESLYASRPSQCRKLHNCSNSVLIFDEAQMLPWNTCGPAWRPSPSSWLTSAPRRCCVPPPSPPWRRSSGRLSLPCPYRSSAPAPPISTSTSAA